MLGIRHIAAGPGATLAELIYLGSLAQPPFGASPTQTKGLNL